MDLITLGAALKGAKTQTESYVDSHFKAGSNITITDNVDGTQTIAASGEVSSEDTVARGEIADHVANTSNPHDVKGDQVELHTYAKATEKVAIASGDKVNEALGKLEKKIDDNVINDSTITIKKNGTIVDSFTTNASSGKEINIAVPSTAADVGALADTVKYAGSASAGGSATSAVKLDNAADSGSLTQPIFFDNGKPKATSYSLAKSVPSDAVFTDTTYESKAAVQSGSDVSLVTTGEKYTWNNKQNAISTSSRLAGNAVNMTGYSKASEQAAISSGDVMTTAIGKLEKKADDNKNNILLSADQTTQYNIVPIKSTITTGNASVTATVAEDKTITITITGTTSSAIGFEISDNFVIDTTAQYVMTGNPSAGAIRLILQQAESPYNWIQQQYNNQAATATPSVSLVRYYVYIYANSSGTIKLKPMLIPKAVYDAGFTDYQPYSLPNTELTTLEKQNDNNIVLLAQYGGGVNKLDCSLSKLKSLNSSSWTWNGNVATSGSQTITVNSNKTLTVHTTNEHGQLSFMLTTLETNQGNLFVSGCPSGGDASTYKIGITNVGYDTGNGKAVPNQTTARQVFIEVSANVAIDLTFKPMIIEQSIHDNGFHGFQPYAMTNVELTERKFNRNIANSSKTYTLENNNQYIITVNSYGAYGVFMAFKYSDEATPRLYEIKKSSSFDSLITITAVTDSNDITIAPVSSSTWFVSGGFRIT